jgi:hypothetical protein
MFTMLFREDTPTGSPVVVDKNRYRDIRSTINIPTIMPNEIELWRVNNISRSICGLFHEWFTQEQCNSIIRRCHFKIRASNRTILWASWEILQIDNNKVVSVHNTPWTSLDVFHIGKQGSISPSRQYSAKLTHQRVYPPTLISLEPKTLMLSFIYTDCLSIYLFVRYVSRIRSAKWIHVSSS